MVTTRSANASKQTHLEDFTTQSNAGNNSTSKHSKTTVKGDGKRKVAEASSPTVKKQRIETSPSGGTNEDQSTAQSKKQVAKSRSGQTKLNTDNITTELASPAKTREYKDKILPPAKAAQSEPDSKSDSINTEEPKDVIIINRSPVLDLWAASVTHFLYPDLSWDTCLSAGSAVASLCAMSKGKSIGIYGTSEDTAERREKKAKEREDKEELDDLEVMHFTMPFKDGLVVLGKDKKKANEAALKTKYGGEDEYARVKSVFEECLDTWKDSKEELNKKAFGMYEKFRPNVAAGQRGWGRKGELSLGTIWGTVRKG